MSQPTGNNGMPLVSMNSIMDQLHHQYFKINAGLVQQLAEANAGNDAMMSHIQELTGKLQAVQSDNASLIEELEKANDGLTEVAKVVDAKDGEIQQLTTELDEGISGISQMVQDYQARLDEKDKLIQRFKDELSKHQDDIPG